MNVSKILKISLPVVILILGYMIYESISEPIRFEKEKKLRYGKVINRLKDLRTLEISYKSVKGKYTDNCDSLLGFLNSEKFMVIKKIGNADDSSAVLVRDTTFVPVKDSLMKVFEYGFSPDSLCIIPFGSGERFKMGAGEIEKGKVTVKVFEISAGNDVIFTGVDVKNFVKLSGGLKVGSMTEPSTSGNWE